MIKNNFETMRMVLFVFNILLTEKKDPLCDVNQRLSAQTAGISSLDPASSNLNATSASDALCKSPKALDNNLDKIETNSPRLKNSPVGLQPWFKTRSRFYFSWNRWPSRQWLT